MHDVVVKMKDGEVHCGPLAMWRPKEGWFSLVLDPKYYKPEAPPVRFYFRDTEAVTEPGARVGPGRTEILDLLAKARREGWDGT